MIGSLARIPWYVDFFERTDLDLSERTTWQQLENFKFFACAYVTWLREIHHFDAGLNEELRVELADPEALCDPNRLDRLNEGRFGDRLNQGYLRRRSLSNL